MLLLLQGVMSAVIDMLNWCRSTALPGQTKLNVGQCLLQSSKEQCINKVNVRILVVTVLDKDALIIENFHSTLSYYIH